MTSAVTASTAARANEKRATGLIPPRPKSPMPSLIRTRLRSLVRCDAELTALDLCAVDDDQDREARPHPARDQTVEADREAGLLSRFTDRGLFRRLVVLDHSTGKCPVTISRSVIQTHEEHTAVALDDRVRPDLHMHEVGEAAHRTRWPIAAVDASGDERGAVARAEREARRAMDHPLASRSFR